MNKKLALIYFALIILAGYLLFSNKEKWYPLGTYVNTPVQKGVYPNTWNGNWGWKNNWASNFIKYPYVNYSALPYLGAASQVGIGPKAYDISNSLLAQGTTPGAIIPYGNPVPLDTIRWNGMFGPMLTSLKSPKDYLLGQWVKAGVAYTDNPNDFTYVDVYQLNLDPGRELFSYAIVNKDGQRIPINLEQGHDRLEDGDRFKVQGMEGKGDFVFSEADKYSYVYV